MQTATYSSPSGDGVLYRTHCPALTMIAWPTSTSNSRSFRLTWSVPWNTTVYSSNCGVCPGSDQPEGLFIRAMLTAFVPGIHPSDELFDDFWRTSCGGNRRGRQNVKGWRAFGNILSHMSQTPLWPTFQRHNHGDQSERFLPLYGEVLVPSYGPYGASSSTLPRSQRERISRFPGVMFSVFVPDEGPA